MHRLPYLVSALVVAALTLAGCSTPAAPDDDPPVLTKIATVDLDSNTAFGPPTVTGPVLEDGADYVIEVQGTFSVWDCRVTNPGWCKGEPSDAPLFPSPGRANGRVMFDANTWFAVPVGEPRCSADGDVPFQTQLFVMSLDGGATFTHVPPSTAGFDADHTYTYEILGAGQAISFRITDTIATDNYGVLRITVSEYR